MKSIRNAFIAVFIIAISFISHAQAPSFITDSLDNYVLKALDQWQIPGVAVLVFKDGRAIVKKGYGVKEFGKSDPVDENTLFMIASNTKAFTGMALAMLDVEGKCSLDDRVQQYLPGFKMKDPWVAEHLTLTDVMSHRIGMETFQGDFMYWESDFTSDQVIEKFGQLTPLYDFRTKWGYCNAGFLIAGKCLEKISGVSWEQFIKAKFIYPLSMKRTLLRTSEINTAENKATAHTLVGGKLTVIPYCHIDNLAPAASISSSVNDMSRWISVLLDNGNYNGQQVIPAEAIKKAQYPRSIIGKGSRPFNKSHYRLYGLGWSLEDYENHEIISHTGGVDGFVTSVTLLPEEKIGIVVLTNTDMNAFYEALKWEIIDAYLGLPYRDYSSVYHERFAQFFANQDQQIQAARDSVNLKLEPSVSLKKFAGRYRHEVYGYIDITAEKDYLIMTFQHHPGLSGKLEYMGADRFLCTYSNPLFGIKIFPFIIKDGIVNSFTLSVADFLEYTTYEFVKE